MKKFILIMSLGSFLAACASTTQIPPELQYSQPVGDSSSLASIRGTVVPSKVSFFASNNSFVYAIDGKHVMAEKESRSLPVNLLPGRRIITVGFQQGAYTAYAKINLDASAGSDYRVKSECDNKGLVPGFSYCDFWIIDHHTETAVSEVMRGPMGGHAPTILVIPGR